MTRAEFRAWAQRSSEAYTRDGAVCRTSREWADKIRPYDPALADLYVRDAETNEAIRAHLMRPR